METKRIKLTDLVLNEGQVAGLPTNPRQWTKTELDKLKKSLQETPELLEARGILVYPWEGKYLVLGGNMRLSALKSLKATDAPCIVFPEDTPIDKLKEVVIKDNGSFGEWDYETLANLWDDLPLADWGVPAWETNTNVSADDFGTDFTLPDGEKQPFRQVSFQLPNEMADVLQFAVEVGKCTKHFYEIEGDEEDKNANGVSIYVIAKSWLDQMKESFNQGEYEEVKKEGEELRRYLRDALKKSGRKASDVDDLLGTSGMSGHYFGTSQWMFPTQSAYEKMREIMELPRDYFECKMVELRFHLYENLSKKIKEWGK